jgi:aryl-alcohol dehydrogenase-like predicted oxidoreductase
VNAQPTAAAAGTIDVGGDLTVNRLGFGAMRITGPGIWGDPPSRDQAIATLRRVVELGVNFIDTADSYGPEVSDLCEQEELVFLPWAPVQEAGKNPAVANAAERHGVTQHQVVLAWMLAASPQILPIPGTGSLRHAEENIEAAAVELDPDEVEAISKGTLPARAGQ